MLYDQAFIRRHIPHSGSMCLLHSVLSLSEDEIICTAQSHRKLDNPLRTAQGLAAANGIEYAAQAMAVHGTVLTVQQGGQAQQGFLASARGVEIAVTRLDQIETDLQIRATRISQQAQTVMYEFEITTHENQLLLKGRAVVILDAAAK